MRVRDGIAVWLTMLAFVPAAVAEDQTPEAKDQTQSQAERKANRSTTDAQNKELAQPNDTERNKTTNNKLQQSMAACLALANHCEIELAKVALDKSQNADVRAFAQKMIDDHTAALEKLKQFMPQANTAQSTDRKDEKTDAQKKQWANQHHDPMQQLMQKVAKNELAMTKEVLMRYEGADFDMGYLGQQIMAHTQMLAKLYAMQDQGSPQFQTTVKNLIETVDKHFKHASQLSRQVEERKFRPASATSNTSSSTTTRRAESTDSANRVKPAAPQEKNLQKAGNRQNE
jgi:predicted outer membrane protein